MTRLGQASEREGFNTSQSKAILGTMMGRQIGAAAAILIGGIGCMKADRLVAVQLDVVQVRCARDADRWGRGRGCRGLVDVAGVDVAVVDAAVGVGPFLAPTEITGLVSDPTTTDIHGASLTQDELEIYFACQMKGESNFHIWSQRANRERSGVEAGHAGERDRGRCRRRGSRRFRGWPDPLLCEQPIGRGTAALCLAQANEGPDVGPARGNTRVDLADTGQVWAQRRSKRALHVLWLSLPGRQQLSPLLRAPVTLSESGELSRTFRESTQARRTTIPRCSMTCGRSSGALETPATEQAGISSKSAVLTCPHPFLSRRELPWTLSTHLPRSAILGCRRMEPISCSAGSQLGPPAFSMKHGGRVDLTTHS
jgi:hypothetical protein